MKTKTWIWLLVGLLMIFGGLSLWLFWPGEAAIRAEVWSDGKMVTTLDLSRDRTLTVESENGINTVTVRNGKIAVTQADCPDGYCMDRGYCSSGPQIVCLPNRLVIRFLGVQAQDSVAG